MSIIDIPIEESSRFSCPNMWKEKWEEYNFKGLILELDHIGETTKFIYLVCPNCGTKLIKLSDVKWIPRYKNDKGYGGSHPINWKIKNNKNYDNKTKIVKCSKCDFSTQLSFFSYGG